MSSYGNYPELSGSIWTLVYLLPPQELETPRVPIGGVARKTFGGELGLGLSVTLARSGHSCSDWVESHMSFRWSSMTLLPRFFKATFLLSEKSRTRQIRGAFLWGQPRSKPFCLQTYPLEDRNRLLRAGVPKKSSFSMSPRVLYQSL